ncbi:glutathione ABC transporter substrate-binding protein [Pullulanibacillus camelliae]|uniref:Glutathione ABC transporter substrate-binding protein n=2 Tax=Pullulanibacillus camelliae TaxID=1707096 RepID=A0A8J2VM57_9BACL|nr:glutathione ABC transporter substrate-binding protein [Pullulanibacillus camelliae]GGE28317.1 glutathione ABC transporter substrate-binding protein [Pullulanibacillus camelliae]
MVFFMGIVLILGMVLSACSSSSSEKSSGTSEGSASGAPQELTYAMTSKIVGLSPIMTNDSVSTAAINQIYETLFTKDPKTLEIKPLLAASYDTPDDKTWVIHLKKNIKFTDGTPFDAEAVKYTFDKLRDPKTGAPRASLLAPVASVTVKDKYTVVIKTKEPYGAMLAALAHENAAIVSPTADKKQDLMKKPVGTGPFMLKEWVAGDHLTLVRNPSYWQGKAKLKQVTFKVVPDVNTAISMLQTGQVDFIDGIPSSQWDRVNRLKGIKTMKKAGTAVAYLGFNVRREPMKNLAFRQAVAYAIDRKAYVKQLEGLGIQSNSIIGPKVFGYDKSAEAGGYSYNPKKAKQMLKENGWEGKTIEMLVANTENYMKMGQIVQDQLQKVGLKVKMDTMEWGTFLDVSRKGNFDITFLSWSNSTADGSELLYPNLHSDNIGSSNVTGYNNAKFNKLVEESRASTDQNYRKQKLDEANKLAIKDAPWVIMDHGVVTAAYKDSIKGLTIDPTGLWSLYKVYKE